jgi:hypothetical protein
MGLFHRHKWEETSIVFKISSSPTQSIFEYVVRSCKKCSERQVYTNGAWVKTDKGIEFTKKLYKKSVQLMAELMKESLDE